MKKLMIVSILAVALVSEAALAQDVLVKAAPDSAMASPSTITPGEAPGVTSSTEKDWKTSLSTGFTQAAQPYGGKIVQSNSNIKSVLTLKFRHKISRQDFSQLLSNAVSIANEELAKQKTENHWLLNPKAKTIQLYDMDNAALFGYSYTTSSAALELKPI